MIFRFITSLSREYISNLKQMHSNRMVSRFATLLNTVILTLISEPLQKANATLVLDVKCQRVGFLLMFLCLYINFPHKGWGDSSPTMKQYTASVISIYFPLAVSCSSGRRLVLGFTSRWWSARATSRLSTQFNILHSHTDSETNKKL